jgi:hypothetical protein
MNENVVFKREEACFANAMLFKKSRVGGRGAKPGSEVQLGPPLYRLCVVSTSRIWC